MPTKPYRSFSLTNFYIKGQLVALIKKNSISSASPALTETLEHSKVALAYPVYQKKSPQIFQHNFFHRTLILPWSAVVLLETINAEWL